MPTLTARRIGCLVPTPPWEGKIVSIYSKALNVRLPDGLLVGFVAYSRQMSPFSILTPELFAVEDALSSSVSVGEVVAAVDWTVPVGHYAVDLLSAEPWSGMLSDRLVHGLSNPVATLHWIESALAVAGAKDGLLEIVLPTDKPTIFGRRAGEIIAALRRQECAEGTSIHGASALVGLGIGFTPSGDDFLSGAILAQELTGSSGGLLDGVEIAAALSKTNDGGRTLLTGVLQRQFPEYLLRLAESLVEADEIPTEREPLAREMVLSAVREAVSHGETSGTDALTGFAWYLRQIASSQFI